MLRLVVVAPTLLRSAQGENAEHAVSILSGTMMCGATGAQRPIMMPTKKKKLWILQRGKTSPPSPAAAMTMMAPPTPCKRKPHQDVSGDPMETTVAASAYRLRPAAG